MRKIHTLMLNPRVLSLSDKACRLGRVAAAGWVVFGLATVLMPDLAHAYSAPTAGCVDNSYGATSTTDTSAFAPIYCSVKNLIVGNVGGSVALGLLGFGVYQAGFGKGGLAGAVPPFITGMLLGMGPTMAGWLGLALA